jgi:hypothetical protein
MMTGAAGWLDAWFYRCLSIAQIAQLLTGWGFERDTVETAQFDDVTSQVFTQGY